MQELGRGCGIIAFSNLTDSASSVKATQGQAEDAVKLTEREYLSVAAR
jgi:hypothetical protein